MKRAWQVAAILLAFLVGGVLASEEHELAVVELDATGAYEGPESLADQVRYSDAFTVEGGVHVEVQARDAEVHVSLVDSKQHVREARAWVDERERLSFGRVPSERYRLRVTARSARPLRVRALTGGFSPTLLAIAVFLVLLPPLYWTLRRNLR